MDKTRQISDIAFGESKSKRWISDPFLQRAKGPDKVTVSGIGSRIEQKNTN